MHDRVTPPRVGIKDDVLPEGQRRELNEYLHTGGGDAGWQFGWKSAGKADQFAFWHRHFAGYRPGDGDHEAYDCEVELAAFPLVHAMWRQLKSEPPLQRHRLIRCYANGHTFGSDGSLHTDTGLPDTFTTIYYPHKHWWPNWGGETVFFNDTKDEIISAIYPRPNRLVMFDGRIPHLARGVTRQCPKLRVTLMFKTDLHHAG
jgi:SM-20-related protein